MEELYLVLGCFGCKINDFVLCCGVRNKILKLDPEYNFYKDLSKYLDSLSLFERQLISINGVRHALFKIKESYNFITHPIWNEQDFKSLEQFTLDHKKCGIYLKVALLDDSFSPCFCEEQSKSVIIKGSG